jgi:hypothetical protein
MAICTEIVVYVTEAGFSVPALLTAAYDTNGALTTDKSDTVTGDIIVLGGDETKLTDVTKGTAVETFAYLTAYSA